MQATGKTRWRRVGQVVTAARKLATIGSEAPPATDWRDRPNIPAAQSQRDEDISQASTASASASVSTPGPAIAPTGFPFAVGTRVKHVSRGVGTVTELMTDGRTKVTYDAEGDAHRYKASSMHKLSEVPKPPPGSALERLEAMKAAKAEAAKANGEEAEPASEGGLQGKRPKERWGILGEVVGAALFLMVGESSGPPPVPS